MNIEKVEKNIFFLSNPDYRFKMRKLNIYVYKY